MTCPLLHQATTLNIKRESYRLKKLQRAGILPQTPPADAEEQSAEVKVSG